MTFRYEYGGEDFCDRDGAYKLKAKIESYWAERGHEVQVDILPGPFNIALRSARFDVRSNLRNGLPANAPLLSQKDAA